MRSDHLQGRNGAGEVIDDVVAGVGDVADVFLAGQIEEVVLGGIGQEELVAGGGEHELGHGESIEVFVGIDDGT